MLLKLLNKFKFNEFFVCIMIVSMTIIKLYLIVIIYLERKYKKIELSYLNKQEGFG